MALELACGSAHSLVLTNKSRVLSCGFGDSYALGHGSNQSLSEFKEIAYFTERFQGKKNQIDRLDAGVGHSGCLVQRRAVLWGTCSRDRQEVYQKPTMIEVGCDVKELYLGDMLTVAKSDSDEVYTMGDNS